MAGVPKEWDYDEVFDTFDRGCGDALIELKTLLDPLPPGTRLMVASGDAGAPAELPAWCRLTRHVLLEARPPYYLIQKRARDEGE
jgi:tRNA 2-thiouridine synthesizing protein A